MVKGEHYIYFERECDANCNKNSIKSLDFTVNRFFMKLFRTGNIEVVKNCQVYFEFSLPSVIWAERVKKFEAKYVTCDRTFIRYGHCMDY